MSHHGDDTDALERDKTFLENLSIFDKKVKQETRHSEKLGEKLGPTNLFPEGKLTASDTGELKFAVTTYKGKVIINFGTRTAWIGFNSEQAIALGRLLIERGEEVLGN